LSSYNGIVIELTKALSTSRKENEMILTIKEIATKLGVHEQTLRNWERLGLLKISRIGGNRTRIYSEKDLFLCKKIVGFSEQGINLRGIKALLAREKYEKSKLISASHRH
jgi:MerR family transcriptional regulator/heat shock protein HspR